MYALQGVHHSGRPLGAAVFRPGLTETNNKQQTINYLPAKIAASANNEMSKAAQRHPPIPIFLQQDTEIPQHHNYL